MSTMTPPPSRRPVLEAVSPENAEATSYLYALRDLDVDKFITLFGSHVAVTLPEGLATEELDKMIASFRAHNGLGADNSTVHHAHKGRRTIFGAPLTQEGICVAEMLIDYLADDQVMRHEGLFRVPGSCSRVAELRQQLCSGETADLTPYSPNDVAQMLKTFLLELPSPLCTSAHVDTLVAAADMGRWATMTAEQRKACTVRRLTCIRLLFTVLNHEHRQLMQILLRLLALCASNARHNRMDAANLAVIFTPALMGDAATASASRVEALSQMVQLMIANSERVFCPPSALLKDVMTYYRRRIGKLQDSCSFPSPGGINSTLMSPALSLANMTLNETLSKDNKENGGGGVSTSSMEPTMASVTFAEQMNAEEAKVEVQKNTDQHMAELYASVRSMPEGKVKTRMIKKLRQQSREQMGLGESPKAKGGRVGRAFTAVKRSMSVRHPNLNVTPSSSSTAPPVTKDDQETTNY